LGKNILIVHCSIVGTYQFYLHTAAILAVRDSARLKYKLMGFMVYF
jgi:hypothetical protein